MESPAGLTAVALFVLWLGYGVPYLVRHRHRLAEARIGDRFSSGLRVVAVGGTEKLMANRADSTTVSAKIESGQGGAMAARTPVSRAQTGTPRTGAAVEVRRTMHVPDRLVRLEARARRAARARRRLIVTLLLLLASAAAWAGVVLDTLHWGVASVPSVLLVLVLALGRRAAVAARRADAMWAAARRAARSRATEARVLAGGGPHAPRNRLRVTGVAVHGSDTTTQVIPRVEKKKRDVLDEILEPEPEPVKVVEVDERGVVPAPVEEPGGLAWNPVPVPLPTYVTKPPAPRREPVPLTGGTPVVPAASAPDAAPGSAPAEGAVADDAARRAEDDLLRGDVPHTRTETLAQPLEEILARRRAAG
ncbi:hypothetical protein L1785_02610 [Antribacter sp. KLBMP9083]|uniref:Uncharacterized protein n=1 Tax=Antribacter soli TaxID=2910976 RepID=A0AA41QD09_9MICO|nr:hypothetical protein [Antribacter soli]MCF4119862.1 hypothetical protein [Antribacter soli]